MAYKDKVLAMHADRLSGYWPLNDAVGSTVALDASGNGYHGVARVTFGQPGADAGSTSALFRCDGMQGSFVDVLSPQNPTGLASKFNGDEYSWMVWAKLWDAALWYSWSPNIITNPNTPTDVRYRLALWYGDSNNSQSLRKADNAGELRFDHFAFPDRIHAEPKISTIGLTDDWFVMIMTGDLASGKMTAYCGQGGTLIYSNAITGMVTSFGSALTLATIGAAQNTGQDRWLGWISDMARWDGVVLSGAEATSLVSRT